MTVDPLDSYAEPVTTVSEDSSTNPEAEIDSAQLEAQERMYVLGITVEALSIAGVATLIAAFAVLVYFADLDIRKLDSLGYMGVFLITFIGAASIVVPMPGLAATAGGGALLDPVAGIPAPVMVGLVAGFAESLGEFSGYALGFGGTPMFEKRRLYRLFHGWMIKYGWVAMFGLSVIPNPLFDLAGVAAGAVRMPLAKFFVAVLAGKILKSMYIAGAGALAYELFHDKF